MVVAERETTDLRDVAAVLARARRDPVWFAQTVLKEHYWPIQSAVMRSALLEPATAVKSCHASGKTRVSAGCVLTYFLLWPGCRILTTATSWTQVEKELWSEIATLHKRLPRSWGVRLGKTQLYAASDWFALGLSTNEGVRFQGHHADHILVVVDEAMGVHEDIWEAIEATRSGGDVHVLAIGNPTMQIGPFADMFGEKSAGWNTFTISAFDTPNLQHATEQRPLTLDELLALPEDDLGWVADRDLTRGLISRRWVRDTYRARGPDSAYWQSRVLGEFPGAAPNALLWNSWLQAARTPVTDDGVSPLYAGLDVAGPGEDETTLVLATGTGAVVVSKGFSDADARGPVKEALLPYRKRIVSLNVDSVGMGHYFALDLADWFKETAWDSWETPIPRPVHPINVGVASSNPEKYANLKAELYWGMRERFQEGAVSGLRDPLMLSQLAGIRQEQTARGQIKIESKDDAAKRGVDSPDRAEGLMLALARPQTPNFLGWMKTRVETAQKETARA